MQRVSFKIAKYLRRKGYPQGWQLGCAYYTKNGDLEFYTSEAFVDNSYCDAPYVLEVWLWLYREKKCNITPLWDSLKMLFNSTDGGRYKDPEDAIVGAINLIVEENLIPD